MCLADTRTHRYIRFGHMGYSVCGDGRQDVDILIAKFKEAVAEVRGGQ